MYKINVTLNVSNSSITSTYTLPVYRRQTNDEKAIQYATYHSGYFTPDMDSDKKKTIYDHYYRYYLSDLSHPSNEDEDENEKNEYIQSYLLQKIKESSDETLITKQIVTKYSNNSNNSNEIDVSVVITPITHLNLSCVDVSEYFKELLKHQSINHANHKIVWVNKLDGEWELFTCAMSTNTKYKITMSTRKNRNDFFSQLTDLAKHRLEYIDASGVVEHSDIKK